MCHVSVDLLNHMRLVCSYVFGFAHDIDRSTLESTGVKINIGVEKMTWLIRSSRAWKCRFNGDVVAPGGGQAQPLSLGGSPLQDGHPA
jgi:hypothetical protein